MLHDELWQAYEIIRTPFDRPAEGTPEKQTILVLDGKGDIYISTDPERFRTTESLSATGLSASSWPRRSPTRTTNPSSWKIWIRR